MLRSEQRFLVTLVALILGPVFMLGPAVLGVAIAVGTHFNVASLLMLPIFVAGSVLISYHMLQNYQWVELKGNVIHGQRFWTRQYVERRIDDIAEIVPLGAAVKTLEAAITNKLLGSVRGYEIRFKDGGPALALIRYDMTNVDAFLEELLKRMEEGD